MHAALIGLLFATTRSEVVQADESSDITTAVAAIKRIGGNVQRTGTGESGWDVEFQIRGGNLTDEQLTLVAALGNVISLNLRDTKITSAGLVQLKDLTSLRRLHLERTAVGDTGVKHLQGLANLEYLNLYSTGVTDRSLEHLAGLTKLRKLYVWQTKVTDAGVDKLERALPQLKVVRGVDLSKLADMFPDEPEPKPPAATLKWIATSSAKDAPKSVNGINTQVWFENKSDRSVKLYWVSYAGELKLYAELEPDERRQQNTYARNTWLITDTDENPLGYFIVAMDEARAVIPKPE